MVSERSKSVCVVGAGPSGLVAARELRKEGHSVVVIEQNHDIGGQWLYNPNTNVEGKLVLLGPRDFNSFLDVHSSVYESLRLMSPRETMGFTDFPFSVIKGRDTRRFPGHREVFLYLKDFCDCFGLRDFIRFNTRVEYVGMPDFCGVSHKDFKWVVRTREIINNNINNNNNNKIVEEIFDAVVVATGHYSFPKLPSLKGMDAWKRKHLHSHYYRVPEPFRNEVVVMVGNSISGQDLTLELVEVVKELYVSAKSMVNVTEGLSKVIAKHDNLHLYPQIESLHEDGKVLFVDGSWVIADTIIYCTGYSYTLPFLDTKGIVSIDDNRVGPLFEHTFPPSLAPSLSFIGIPKRIIGFPFFESQAKWVAQVLRGKRALPSIDDMIQSVNNLYLSRELAGLPKHDTHDIFDFEYCDRYGDYVGFPHLEEWRKELCISAYGNYLVNLETFKDSYEQDHDLLQKAFQSPHFTQQPPEMPQPVSL